MEKPHKIMFSVVVVMLYWLAASGFSDVTGLRSPDRQNIELTGSGIFVVEALPFASGFAVKESVGFWSAGSAAQGTSKQSQLHKAVLYELDVQVACAFLQYTSQLHNNPVRIRKSDMLFPFHYFFETV